MNFKTRVGEKENRKKLFQKVKGTEIYKQISLWWIGPLLDTFRFGFIDSILGCGRGTGLFLPNGLRRV
ncbi:hypothetical protein BKC07_10620 [Peribacillus simplex]|nr:hypothetical protein BKC07_10620 [Peribacillus simplex]